MSGRFHHLDIYVANLGRAAGFWGPFLEQLGFAKVADQPAVKSWKGGGAELFFVQAEPEFVAQGYHRKRVGLNHLAFAVDSRDELEALLAWVIQRGQRLLYTGRIEETATQHRFFFEDPEKIKVEVVAAR